MDTRLAFLIELHLSALLAFQLCDAAMFVVVALMYYVVLILSGIVVRLSIVP